MPRYICLFFTSVNLFWWRRGVLLVFSLGILLCCVCVCAYIKVYIQMYVGFFSFIYLFPATEPTVGPRCVARKQCPMATAEAHASTRTFLWKKQDKPVQCKSEFTMPACFFYSSPVLLCHHIILNTFWRHLSSLDLVAFHCSNTNNY